MKRKAVQKRSLCPVMKGPGHKVSSKALEEEGCPGKTGSLRGQDKGGGHDGKEVKLGVPLRPALGPHQSN